MRLVSTSITASIAGIQMMDCVVVPDRFPYWHQRQSMQNIAFLDGHGAFVRIRKGIYVDSRYTMIPFKDMRAEFAQCQQEIPCP